MNSSRPVRSSLIYAVMLVALGLFVVSSFARNNDNVANWDIGQVAQAAREGNVERITVNGSELDVELSDGKKVRSRKEDDGSVVETLRNLGVPEERFGSGSEPHPDQRQGAELPGPTCCRRSWLVLPVLLLAGFFIFIMRQAQGAGNQAFSFGKSRARMFTGDKPTVTFADVAGAEEAKQELQEVVEFLKEPQKFAALGARIPKGVLLVGPPGTGKTLMAKAVSGEAGVPFFSISGSEFVEMFVGVGASRVRDLFEQAKRNSPCIIFIDEIDAVGRQRGAGLGGSHDEREQTLNQILVEMDGFDTDTNVILVAATNRPDILDPALLRPGRFDRQVVMDRPDMKGREAILKVHVRGKPLEPDVDLDTIARGTPGLRRRRPGEPGQRGGHPGGAAQQALHRHERVPGSDRARDRRPRAQEPHHLRPGEGDHRLPRGRPCPGDADAAQLPTRCTRSASSAAAWRSATPCRCPKRTDCCSSRNKLRDELAGPAGRARWPRRSSSATSRPAPATTWSA